MTYVSITKTNQTKYSLPPHTTNHSSLYIQTSSSTVNKHNIYINPRHIQILFMLNSNPLYTFYTTMPSVTASAIYMQPNSSFHMQRIEFAGELTCKAHNYSFSAAGLNLVGWVGPSYLHVSRK